MTAPAGKGPLHGLRIVEMAGIGPVPYAAMLLAEMGADIVRIDRPAASGLGLQLDPRFDLTLRSRRSVAIDLKHEEGRSLVLELVGCADALIEGFRPGTMERLGLGPEPCMARQPKLVYGRVTGWGQDGPLARAAGHDLNYIALSGALAAIGRAAGPPAPPLNLVGDFAGGSLFLAMGVLAALLHVRSGGDGQVVDAAMVDGASSLMTLFHGLAAAGAHAPDRGTNLLDGGAPHYDVYRCADGLEISVAPIEGKFQAELLRLMGFEQDDFPQLDQPDGWDAARRRLADRFARRTRAEWCAILEGTDACVAPVLTLEDAPRHPHNAARNGFLELDGIVQPAPAPRFSRSGSLAPTAPRIPGADTVEALAAWGIAPERIETLLGAGAIVQGSG